MFHAVSCSSKMVQNVTPTMVSELQITECHWNTIRALFLKTAPSIGEGDLIFFFCLFNDTVQ